MNNVNVEVKVLKTSEPKQVTTGGAERTILEVEVGDEAGSITLVLWDDKVMPLDIGNILRIENGFVTSFRGDWRINVGRYGKVTKV